MRRRLYHIALVPAAALSLAVAFTAPQIVLQRNHPYFADKSITRLAAASDDDYEEAPTSLRKRPGRIRPRRSTVASAQAEVRQAEAKARHAEALKDPTLLTNVNFAERTDLHPSTKRALTEIMGLEAMTEIQAKTYAAVWSGRSVLGRARTGTGKTLAFLIPTLERLLQGDPSLYHSGRNIGVLIVAPTRELAIQIADEARALLTYHPKDLSVLCFYGGTKMHRDTALLNKRIPSILVATPGRLLDHISETRVLGRRFSDIISLTKIVVLDETDRLLDMGFQKDIKKILSYLPRPEKRQTLMFSATIPKRLQKGMQDALAKDFVQVDCVGDSKLSTNARVKQTYTVLDSMDDYVTKLVEIVRSAMRADDDYKILVFFPAAKLVRFFYDLFNVGLQIPVLEMHSRMSQGARQRASSEFRRSKCSILFTSDVSARGVDYPDVTDVIQYGAADSKTMHTHRTGRTGRAGRSGQGLVVLLPFEAKLVDSLRRINLVEDDRVASNDTLLRKEVNNMIIPVRNRIKSGDAKLTSSAEAAYRAFLAYYMSRVKSTGLSRDEVVESASRFAKSIGLIRTPSISATVAKKLNLVGVKGVAVDDEASV